MLKIRNIILAGASIMALPSPAWAQDEAPSQGETPTDEIVVTGTLVRGVEPTGTAVIGINRSAVEASGASTVTQLLQTVPQFGSFGTIQAPIGGGNSVTTNRPNLRNLSSANSNGAASTLMLVDGHRVVGMGVQQTSPDLDTIAPGAIERVDVVPDGGSATYGADAVGGVVNFITRKTFDGIALDGRFGFADNYKTWDTNATVGKTWDGGGIYVSYNYSQHDPIYGSDRDWVQQFPQNAGLAVPVRALTCPTPNVQVGTNVYGLPFTPSAAAKLNQPNQCDLSDYVTVYPQERRHSVFASLTQDLSDSLTFELKGFFMDRKQGLGNGMFTSVQSINAGGSPYRNQYIVSSPTESQKVSFAWGGIDAARQDVHLHAWGVTPTFTAKLGSNWQGRLMFNYGESNTLVHSPSFNPTALSNAIKAGLFNPYNPTDAATNNSTALAAIADWETFGQAKQSQFQARAIIDGELFQLPGGGAKIAFGAEYLHETLRSQKGDIVPGTENSGFPGQSVNGTLILPAGLRLPIFHTGRNVKSAFGEIVMPVLADVPGAKELTVSASGRYDSYSDAGNTFNPKIGLTWKPIDQLRIRAQWGHSFAAPSLANSAKADPANAAYGTGSGFAALVNSAGIAVLTGLGYPAPTAANSTVLLVRGGSDSLQPQKAQTWSVGADLEPFEGARLSLTYWNIKFNNVIGAPGFSNSANFFSQFGGSYVIIPSVSTAEGLAAINTALTAAGTNVSGAPCTPLPQCIYAVEFANTQNLGKFHQDGLDFAVNYLKNMGFGSIDFSSAGTYILNRKQSVSATTALLDQIPNGLSRLRIRTALGAQIHQLRAQVVWNYTAGYDFAPANPALAPFYPEQSHIGAFNTIDLFFKYDFAGEGAMKDLALTLGVNNVFDAAPPVRYALGTTPSQYGYVNGSTIGRLMQIGFSKKF